jgi:hypothetical protein
MLFYLRDFPSEHNYLKNYQLNYWLRLIPKKKLIQMMTLSCL